MINNFFNINFTKFFKFNTSSLSKEDLGSVIIGILLGDGHLYKGSNLNSKNNPRLEMSFGEKYKDYAEFVGELFKDLMNNPIKSIDIKGKDKIYKNYRLKTASLPLFNKYFEMFYKFDSNLNKTIKRIPDNIVDLLNPIVLAYLIMSDGNFDKNRNRIRIYTNSFTKTEVSNLSYAINSKFNIYTAVLHDRKNQ